MLDRLNQFLATTLLIVGIACFALLGAHIALTSHVLHKFVTGQRCW